MRFVLGVIVVCAIVFGALYFGGGYSSLDPTKQGREVMAAIKPGMTWQAAIAKAGEPRNYRVFLRVSREVAGVVIEDVKLSGEAPFSRDNLAQRIKDNSMPDGFMFPYTFSPAMAFAIEFDSSGTVLDVKETTTVADLLDR